LPPRRHRPFARAIEPEGARAAAGQNACRVRRGDRADTGDMIRGSLSHLDLTVADLARSVAFYDRVLARLGYRRRDEAGAGAPCWGLADASGSVFTIALKAARPERKAIAHDRYAPGLHHLAFHADSRDDVDGFYGFLLALGARVLDPPAEYGYTPGYYAVFFADPDGIKLEVVFEPEFARPSRLVTARGLGRRLRPDLFRVAPEPGAMDPCRMTWPMTARRGTAPP
jgi:glyoxylase I family protein